MNYVSAQCARLNVVAIEVAATLDLCASIVIEMPVIEGKALLGRHVYMLANLLDLTIRRTAELGAPAEYRTVRNAGRLKADQLVEASELSTPEVLRKYLLACYLDVQGALAPLISGSDVLIAGLDEPTCQFAREAIYRLQQATGQLQQCIASEAVLAFGWKPTLWQWVWRDIPKRPGRDERFALTRVVDPRATGDSTEAVRFHRTLMSLEIPTIEACAQNILEDGGLPIEFLVDMCRQSYDEARHADAFILGLRELRCALGAYPISLDLWELTHQHEVAMRLAIHQRAGETIGVNSAQWWSRKFEDDQAERFATLYAIIMHDEVAHVRQGNYWIWHICGNSQEAVSRLSDQAYEIRAAQTTGVIDGQKKYPIDRALMLSAGYTPVEIARME